MQSPVGGKDVPSRVHEIFGVNIAFTTFTILIILLRIWTRLWFVKELKVDDYIMMFVGGATLFYGIDVCLQTHYGFGYHIYDLVDLANFSGSLKLFYGGELTYYINVGLTKISLLIFYLRLFVTSSYHKLRILTWVLLIFTACLTVTWAFAIIFQCNPIEKAWYITMPGTCINMTAIFYTHAGINIVLDFIIYIMPMPMLWGVNRPLRDRIALVVIFAVGGFVCVVGVVRLQSLREATISQDPSWDNVPSGVWSCIEMNVGIICACLPSLKPFFSKLFGQVATIKSITKSNNTQNFQMLSDSQTGLHQSQADIEMPEHNKSYSVVRTDDFRMETKYIS